MAYVLPMLVHIMAQPELKPGEGPVGLVLLPTRELSQQVQREITCFAQWTQLRCESVFGGEDIETQTSMLLDRVDVLTATPGRLITLLNEKKTNLRRVTYVVMDEADDLLDRSFGPQVRLIMSQIRPDRQVLLFSATWSEQVKEFAEEVCEEKTGLSQGTVRICVNGLKLSACKDIVQEFWTPGNPETGWRKNQPKTEALCNSFTGLIANELRAGQTKAIVFCNKTEDVACITDCLRNAGFECEGYSSTSTVVNRVEQLKRFRETGSNLHMLVATDLLARGHDFTNVKYVINYDMPGKLVNYVHRIGRTGRMGQPGYSLTFLDESDLRFARELCELLKETHPDRPVPKWLKREVRNVGQRWRDHHNRNRQGGAVAVEGESAQGAAEWKGRGRGRRNEFLEELGNSGIGRRLDLVPVQPARLH